MHEVTVAFTGVSTVSLFGPPGYSGSLPLVLGAPFSESYTGGSDMLAVVPFATSISMDGMAANADIPAFWREYQILAAEVEIQFLAGQSYNPGIGSPLPEVHIYSDVVDAVPPISVADGDRHGDAQRWVVSAERTARFQVQPKPVAQMFLSGTATSYSSPASNRELWLSTQSLGTPHYSFKGLMRNFVGVPGSGAVMRFSFIAYINLRRSQ